MSSVLLLLDEALAEWRHAHSGRPAAAIRLGERLHAQLLLDIAAAKEPLPGLETALGRPVRFQDVELFCDDQVIDALRVV